MKFLVFSFNILFIFFLNCAPKEKEVTQNLTKNSESNLLRDSLSVGILKFGNINHENRLLISYPITAYEFVNASEKKYAISYVNKFNNEYRYNDNPDKKTGYDFIQHFDVPINNKIFLGFLYSRYTTIDNEYRLQKRAIVYDLKAKKKLAIENTFKDIDSFRRFAEHIKSIARDSVINRINQFEGYNQATKDSLKNNIDLQLTKGTKALQANYNALYFTPDGYWHLYIHEDQIAPKELKSFQLDLAPEDVEPYLKENLKNINKTSHLPIHLKSLAFDATNKNDSIDCNNEKCIALTFGLGSTEKTINLLKVLNDKDIKATFFVLGQTAKHQPKILQSMVENGHSIGNLGYSHRDFSRISKEEAEIEINKTDSIINYMTGYNSKYFSFPYETYSKEKLEKVDKPVIACTQNLKDFIPSENDGLNNDGPDNFNGAIFKFNTNSDTPEQLERVIDALQTKGYTFVTLEQLFKGKNLKNKKVYYGRDTE